MLSLSHFHPYNQTNTYLQKKKTFAWISFCYWVIPAFAPSARRAEYILYSIHRIHRKKQQSMRGGMWSCWFVFCWGDIQFIIVVSFIVYYEKGQTIPIPILDIVVVCRDINLYYISRAFSFCLLLYFWVYVYYIHMYIMVEKRQRRMKKKIISLYIT